jgi:hypothetical protein
MNSAHAKAEHHVRARDLEDAEKDIDNQCSSGRVEIVCAASHIRTWAPNFKEKSERAIPRYGIVLDCRQNSIGLERQSSAAKQAAEEVRKWSESGKGQISSRRTRWWLQRAGPSWPRGSKGPIRRPTALLSKTAIL